jgi:hypothetical protein
MRNNSILSVLSFVFALSFLLTSCQLVEGIFKAGMWVGILCVVGIIAVIIFIVSKLGNRGVRGR